MKRFEDRMAPEPPGPWVFSWAIRNTPLASPFWPPTSIAKYNGETKPELWLVDFQLACQLGGARGDDRAIIQQLPLFLSDIARRWLEELPTNQIYGWADLVWLFVTPKFKDKFEYNKPHVRPRISRAHKSTNYKCIITSVLHNVITTQISKSATSGNKTHI